MAELRSDIDDFTRRDLTLLGKTKPVLTTGAVGPAVITDFGAVLPLDSGRRVSCLCTGVVRQWLATRSKSD